MTVECTRRQRRCALPWNWALVRLLSIGPGCWNFRLGLDSEQRCGRAGDKREQELQVEAGCGVSTPAARTECGVSSGA